MKKIIVLLIIGIILIGVVSRKEVIANAKYLDDKSIITEKNGWIYYTKIASNRGENKADTTNTYSIYRIATDGTKQQELSKDKTLKVVVEDEYIYYDTFNMIDSGKEDSIYRMKLDGKEKVDLKEKNAQLVTVRNNFVYYASKEYGNLCRMKIDGTQKQKIIDSATLGKIYINKDYIYYTEHFGTNIELSRIKLDGTNKTSLKVLYKADIIDIKIKDDWIYYITESYDENGDSVNRLLMKMKLDGTEETKVLAENNITMFNIIDNKIYYFREVAEQKQVNPDAKTINLTDKKVYLDKTYVNLYKVNLDGSSKQKIINYDLENFGTSDTFLIEDNNNFFKKVGNYIYYLNDADGSRLYKVNENTKQKERLSNTKIKEFKIFNDKIYYVEYEKIYKMNLDGTEKVRLD